MDRIPEVTEHEIPASCLAHMEERAVLGAALQSAEAAALVVAHLTKDDFFQHPCQDVLTAMVTCAQRHEPIDRVSVMRWLLDAGHGDHVASSFLLDLEEAMPSVANVEYYIRLVRRAAVRRTLREKLQTYYHRLANADQDVTETVQHLTEDLDVASHDHGDHGIVPAKLSDTLKVWMTLVEHGEKPRRVPTHIPRLNVCLGGGMADGRLYYLGARPSVGKTSWALDVARYAAKQGHGVLVVSLEMPEVDGITTRALSQESLVSELSVRSGMFTDAEYPKLTVGYGSLAGLPIWVTEQAVHIDQICRCAERWMFTPRLDLVIVDYLQLVRGPKSESRRVETDEISRMLKHLAVKIKAPVLCISALRRRDEDDREPSMSDLKETGQLEYDGDAVLLLHRGFNAEAAKLIVAKNKYGPVGTVPLIFKKSCVTFEQAPEE